MSLVNSIFLLSWIVFVVYWIFSSIGVNKTTRGVTWIQIAIFIFAATQLQNFRSFFKYFEYNILIPYNYSINIIGTFICVFGIALAIYAKWYLGSNWGMPSTLKEKQELITTGPYHFIRHPIYTGILLSTFGSSLAHGINWFILFAFLCVYFVYGAMKEDWLLNEKFPDQYPKYKKKTTMFIPFIF